MRFPILDPLRGIAALWVFSLHYPFSEAFKHSLPFLENLFEQGALGVPMFFVISGFCITASAKRSLDKDKAVSSFMYRRVRRIYPTYWFSILLILLLPFIFEALSFLKTGQMLWPSSTDSNYPFYRYSLLEWLRYITLLQVFYPLENIHNLALKFTSINSVYWTLGIEVQFYLVAAVAMLFRKKFYLFLLLISLISIPFAYFGWLTTHGIFLPYWPMFALGTLLYWLLSNEISSSKILAKKTLTPNLLLLLGLCLTFLYFVWTNTKVNEFHFCLLFTLSLWLIEPFRFKAESNSKIVFLLKLLSIKLFIALGAMSYSLYLTHTKLRYLAQQIATQLLPANTITLDIAVFTLSCIFAFFFYWLFERPFSRPIKSK